VSLDTESSELSRRRMHQIADLDREYERRHSPSKGQIFNGSTKLITGMLALMNILTAAAIVGGVVMYGRVTSLDDKVNLIIEGRIRVPHD
jgi:hypothetical protein